MQKLNPAILVLIIVLAVGVDLNLVLPFLGVGVDVIPDTIPLLGNLDESVLTVFATLAGQELHRRRVAASTAKTEA